MTSGGTSPSRPFSGPAGWVLDCGARYWPKGRAAIEALPIPDRIGRPADFMLRDVTLPAWAADCGIDGQIPVPASTVDTETAAPDWQRCDWIGAAFHLLNGSAERHWEKLHGPVLSYAFRLPAVLSRLHDHAWVNRIFLFLRRWAAHVAGAHEEQLFGPLPTAEIILTHDVDAITLTPEIRLKQVAFQFANGGRALLRGDLAAMTARLADAARYGLSRGDFRTLGRVRAIEQAAGLRSTLHFYAGPPGLKRGSPRRMLIDPAYDILAPEMRRELAALRAGGWTIGLHQSFDAWRSPAPMQAEKARLETAAAAPIAHCRQHWLHFSWEETWTAQAEAGLTLDSTLGFNDRPGFRTGHALRIRPWDAAADRPIDLEILPMVLMDSHFYDYGAGETGRDVAGDIAPWIREIRAVGGTATVNWHTHTITPVYGWGEGYEALVALIA